MPAPLRARRARVQTPRPWRRPRSATTPEHERLEEARTGKAPWKAWGPYLSERQWGTVREDYSQGGDAWDYFTHDQARSRAYRWGEDGIAGICDERQRLCLALALWNGADPILKERMFGLTNSRGQPRRGRQGVLVLPRQHADALLPEVPVQVPAARRSRTRTWSPRTRAAASRRSSTSCWTPAIFDEDRYFDVVVEYAKGAHDDILMLVTAHNRGPDAATLHLLPTLWFRNTWSWGGERREADR